jgi:hypothetical protein
MRNCEDGFTDRVLKHAPVATAPNDLGTIMIISRKRDLRAGLLVASALGMLAAHGVALAQNTSAPGADVSQTPATEVVVTAAKSTRSAVFVTLSAGF